jgi:hypothetical protein
MQPVGELRSKKVLGKVYQDGAVPGIKPLIDPPHGPPIPDSAIPGW